jgi:Tfp pilus assembly protein PilX
MIRNQHSIQNTRRDQGNALLLSLIILVLLMGISVGQFAITRSNIRQSDFYAGHNELSVYAQTGCNLALHDLRYSVTG